VDVAFVEQVGDAGVVRLDGDQFGQPTSRIDYLNIYNVTTSTVARVHNILSGEMTLELVDGGSSIQGSISVQGSSGSGGPGIGSFYSAEFTGTRIGE
jgi:hypothetical protein